MYIYMHLHTHARMPAASMPAVAWVRDRTRAKPPLPPAAMPATALPAATLLAAGMQACVCRCMYVYVYVYMEYHGVLKGTMGFSPNFDFLFSFDVLVQKTIQDGEGGSQKPLEKTNQLSVIHLFIFF